MRVPIRPRGQSPLETAALASYLAFDVGGAEYALPLGQVEEIVPLRSARRSPHGPRSLSGRLPLRGEVVAVLDLAVILGEAESVFGEQACAVVARAPGVAARVALAVHEVRTVLEVAPGAIAPPPRLAGFADVNLLAGVARLETRLVPLLDLVSLLDTDEAVEAARAAGRAEDAEPADAAPGTEPLA
jgi:purine-binding chemotaxis protein CheW